MRKIFLLLSLFLLFAISTEARKPVLSVTRSGGIRNWYTFWQVTYRTVKYSSCDGSLQCKGAGPNACRAPKIISNNGNGYEIDNFIFSDEIISTRINATLDDVDDLTLPDSSSSEGSLSNTYLLYDVEGNPHYVSFYATWTDSNWETGDAYIEIKMSVIFE